MDASESAEDSNNDHDSGSKSPDVNQDGSKSDGDESPSTKKGAMERDAPVDVLQVSHSQRWLSTTMTKTR
jgi:hypothetical protein